MANSISRIFLVLSLTELGDFVEGIANGEELVQMAESTGRQLDQVYAYLRVGYLYLRKGSLHQAIPLLENGFGLCQTGDIIATLFPQ